jgi:hypothetical protein
MVGRIDSMSLDRNGVSASTLTIQVDHTEMEDRIAYARAHFIQSVACISNSLVSKRMAVLMRCVREEFTWQVS